MSDVEMVTLHTMDGQVTIVTTDDLLIPRVFVLFEHHPQENPMLLGVFSSMAKATSSVPEARAAGRRLWVPYPGSPDNTWVLVYTFADEQPDLYVVRYKLDEWLGE